MWWTQVQLLFILQCSVRHGLRHVDRHWEANLHQHQVLVSDLDLGSKTESKITPTTNTTTTALADASTAIGTYLDRKRCVVTHRLLSNSPPPTTAEGTHSSQLQTTIQTHAPRSCTNTTGCSSKWPCACMLRSPRARTTVQGCDRAHWIQIENNKCSSGWLTDSHYCHLGCIAAPLLTTMRSFSVRFGERQTGTNKTMTAVTISLLEWPPASLLDINMAHSRASGNQRESFELCREPD